MWLCTREQGPCVALAAGSSMRGRDYWKGKGKNLRSRAWAGNALASISLDGESRSVGT